MFVTLEWNQAASKPASPRTRSAPRWGERYEGKEVIRRLHAEWLQEAKT